MIVIKFSNCLSSKFAPAIARHCLSEESNSSLQIYFSKSATTAVEGNKGEVWYYILELAKYSFPWLIFFPGGLIVAWKKRQKKFN